MPACLSAAITQHGSQEVLTAGRKETIFFFFAFYSLLKLPGETCLFLAHAAWHYTRLHAYLLRSKSKEELGATNHLSKTKKAGWQIWPGRTNDRAIGMRVCWVKKEEKGKKKIKKSEEERAIEGKGNACSFTLRLSLFCLFSFLSLHPMLGAQRDGIKVERGSYLGRPRARGKRNGGG